MPTHARKHAHVLTHTKHTQAGLIGTAKEGARDTHTHAQACSCAHTHKIHAGWPDRHCTRGCKRHAHTRTQACSCAHTQHTQAGLIGTAKEGARDTHTHAHTHKHVHVLTHTKHTQAGLIGTAKEGARDTRVRTMLHKQWQEEQDAKEVRQIEHGLKYGFGKPSRNGLDGDMVSDSACWPKSTKYKSLW